MEETGQNATKPYNLKDTEFVCFEDGRFYFWPESSNQGGYSSANLRVIADYLDKINKHYEDELDEYFRSQSSLDHDLAVYTI